MLRAADAEVIVPSAHFCCGRPLYDYGFLDMAKDYLRRILAALGPEIDRGTPLVVLEPSCCSVFRDELTNLFPDVPRAERLKKQTFTLSEFLERQEGFAAPTLQRKAVIHGHCHHKAVMRMKAEESIFKKIGLDYTNARFGLLRHGRLFRVRKRQV